MENNKISGLDSVTAASLLNKIGPNILEAKKKRRFYRIFKFFLSPISLMFLAAAALSYFNGRVFDAYFIIFLMLVNFSVSFWQESKADHAISQLNKLLHISIKVLRDNKWINLDSSLLVPGDIVSIYIGDVIPADMEILEVNNFYVNEAAVTGESLPIEKNSGAKLFSGSFAVTGQALARVKATGVNTYFGKILSSTNEKSKRSILEQDIITISRFLSLMSLMAVAVLTVIFFFNHQPLLEILSLDISLVIAGIPIALPTVLTLIISLGVFRLSKEDVIVRRLASLEDLANVDVLFTDKTGTLTKNQITVTDIISYDDDNSKTLTYAYLAAISNEHDIINQAIIKKLTDQKALPRDYKIIKFVPADSERKRNSATIIYKNHKIKIEVGAPQVIASLCKLKADLKQQFNQDIERAAEGGYRVLAVASGQKDLARGHFKLIGLLFLSDDLRRGAKQTINFLKNKGVKIKMLTGDHSAIAYRIGSKLGIDQEDIYPEILPDDKYRLVLEAKSKHIVAVTGDGINDLPAVKAADVSLAVNNAVNALKSSADIVLLSSGIGVIQTAIIESRKIFSRLHSYSVYRISESFRLIVTIFILGIIYKVYPLSPIQLILLAIFNDIPIISLAFNRVKVAPKPVKIEVKKRFILSLTYGFIGVINSLLFLLILNNFWHYGWDIIATAFFLKLTISGHLLVLVAHTEESWYKFLPSKQVLWAVGLTQLLASLLAALGIFMNKIPLWLIGIIWLWAIIWMQISDRLKSFKFLFSSQNKIPA